MCRYGNVGMCRKSVYQYPLHEVVWDFGDVAAKSHFRVAPREWGCPQLLRELPSPVSNTVTQWLLPLGLSLVPKHSVFQLLCLRQQPSQPCWLAVPSSLSWRLGLQRSGTGAVGDVHMQKPLAPAEHNYRWSGRNRAVCFEFSFSCQYCYLPNPLTLQCSSWCFKDLNGIVWNPKFKYRWVLFTSSSPYNSYSGAKAATVIFPTSSG